MQSTGNVPTDQFVVLTDNRQQTRLLRIKDNKQFKWRKTPIPLKAIAESPFYTLFQVGNNKVSAIEWVCEQPECAFQEQAHQQQNNNKEIFLIEQAQKLQTEQIEKKKQELKPQELIHQLVQNNEQFGKRSEYSKEKYIKKKERKYLFHFYAQPVSLASLHSHYFKNDLKAICSIRWDLFALMLLYAGPYNRVLAADQGRGLLLGAALQRGAHSLTALVGKPLALRQFNILEQLNIGHQQLQKIRFVEWKDLKQENQRFDNLLLMGNYDFQQVVSAVDHLLSRGAIVAFFCLSLSPLQQAARDLQKRGYLNVKIFDSWAREYQVLKNRTHPTMSMNSCSGYLLTALKMDLLEA